MHFHNSMTLASASNDVASRNRRPSRDAHSVNGKLRDAAIPEAIEMLAPQLLSPRVYKYLCAFIFVEPSYEQRLTEA